MTGTVHAGTPSLCELSGLDRDLVAIAGFDVGVHHGITEVTVYATVYATLSTVEPTTLCP